MSSFRVSLDDCNSFALRMDLILSMGSLNLSMVSKDSYCPAVASELHENSADPVHGLIEFQYGFVRETLSSVCIRAPREWIVRLSAFISSGDGLVENCHLCYERSDKSITHMVLFSDKSN
jgi:hypothetical protein